MDDRRQKLSDANKNNSKKGIMGENIAKAYLKHKGYTILDSNFFYYNLNSKRGEIDIIAKIDNIIVFVEVKYCKSLRYGLPRSKVVGVKQLRIIKAANHYLKDKNINDSVFRFDIIEIVGEREYTINHIENAFTGEINKINEANEIRGD